MFRPLIKPSSIELKIMQEMDRRNLNYVRQFKIGICCVDFAFPDKKLAVECDGDYWHANPEKYPAEKLNRMQVRNSEIDKERNEIVSAAGWKLLRFWESKIERDVVACVDIIEKNLSKRRVARRIEFVSPGLVDDYW